MQPRPSAETLSSPILRWGYLAGMVVVVLIGCLVTEMEERGIVRLARSSGNGLDAQKSRVRAAAMQWMVNADNQDIEK